MLKALLRHDRYVVIAELAVIIALAWAWLLLGAGIEGMDMGGGQVMLMPPTWTPFYAILILVMWIVMMTAMMLPSAAPVILLVAALMRQGQGSRGQGAVWLFALGYLAVWSAFSVVATTLQWGLDSIGQLSVMMASNNAVLAGSLLILAGIYQWTPWKRTCLRHCRSPLEWVTRNWRKGLIGPARAGARHGLFCLGCCWLLMALLFVFGLMNILWIAALAILVFVEKVLPFGPRLSQATGVALAAWGVTILIR